MHPVRLVSPLLAALLALAAPGAQANVSEGFDSGAAGWTAVDVVFGAYTSAGTAVTLQHLTSGGNPGGYIQATDPSDQSFFFHAPAAFLGNLSAYAGGVLSFDSFYTPHDNAWTGDPDLILSNGTTTLFYKGAANPGADWTPVSITLAAGSGWTVGSFNGTAASAADFAAVLPAVSLLRIRAEYYAGVVETTGLDNVMLSAVPEPGAWAMLLGGLGVLGLRLRRRPANPA